MKRFCALQQEVIIKLLDKHGGKPLSAALWSAQREVYGDDVRRPYVATGVYPQRLRIKRQDVIGRMVSPLAGTLSGWKKTLAGIEPNESEKVKALREHRVLRTGAGALSRARAK